jgi:hypothetical protein
MEEGEPENPMKVPVVCDKCESPLYCFSENDAMNDVELALVPGQYFDSVFDTMEACQTLLECTACHSISVHCAQCSKVIKLVERSKCMEGEDYSDLISWRTNGETFSTTTCKEFCKHYNIDYQEQFESWNERGSNTQEHLERAFKSKYSDLDFDAHYNMVHDRMHAFGGTHDSLAFMVDDLDLFRLDSDEPRLMSSGERIIFDEYAVLERAFVKFACPHGTVVVDGHDD